jgi:hypothetical protein
LVHSSTCYLTSETTRRGGRKMAALFETDPAKTRIPSTRSDDPGGFARTLARAGRTFRAWYSRLSLGSCLIRWIAGLRLIVLKTLSCSRILLSTFPLSPTWCRTAKTRRERIFACRATNVIAYRATAVPRFGTRIGSKPGIAIPSAELRSSPDVPFGHAFIDSMES